MMRYPLSLPVAIGLLLSSFCNGQDTPVISQETTPVTFTLYTQRPVQTIHNIGASGCWFSEGIGKYWPSEKKEQIAEWLFSRETDGAGNPKGIGLSAWRFNIGGGTAEQGDSSGIRDFRRRVEGFLGADGQYDWNKQQGYTWFVKKAKEYGVKDLVAFSNTPPVQFTRNGYGFKTEKDYTSNLRPDKYADYAGFLADVLEHFRQEGLPFQYISPVNEPQWDWSSKPGQAGQEGSPWQNAEIHKVVHALDSALTSQKLDTKIMVTEAGTLDHLFRGNGQAAKQIRHFFGKESPMNLEQYPHMASFVGGHSYFTDAGDSSRIRIREMLRDTARAYGIEFWQTEYSMLGDGFREGQQGKRSAMDCALFLAKVIHTDLAVANASAWHLWNSYEPGNAHEDTRYYLIALEPNPTHTDGSFHQTKGLWAMGNFSRFVRPGMKRILTGRSDGKDERAAAQDIMISAYTGNGQVVAVLINYTAQARKVSLDMPGAGKARTARRYVTSAHPDHNLRMFDMGKRSRELELPGRSVTTVVWER